MLEWRICNKLHLYSNSNLPISALRRKEKMLEEQC